LKTWTISAPLADPSAAARRLGYALAEPSDTNASNFYVNNHLRFTIRYHDVQTKGTRMEQVEAPGALIVGFEIKAMSIDHQFEGKWNDKCVETNTCELFTCDPNTGPEPTAPKLVLKPHKKMDVVFTYDVLWVHSDVKWASRWDVYLQMQWQDDEIHWFSIVNSSVILLFLSGMVAMIMLRILRKDLYRCGGSLGIHTHQTGLLTAKHTLVCRSSTPISSSSMLSRSWPPSRRQDGTLSSTRACVLARMPLHKRKPQYSILSETQCVWSRRQTIFLFMLMLHRRESQIWCEEQPSTKATSQRPQKTEVRNRHLRHVQVQPA